MSDAPTTALGRCLVAWKRGRPAKPADCREVVAERGIEEVQRLLRFHWGTALKPATAESGLSTQTAKD